MGKNVITEMDSAAAKVTLEGLFDRIDALITKDGQASYEELTAVFGEHAEEFLKFCDKDTDKKLTKDEFTSGILGDCDGMSQEDFDTNWANRMEGVVAAAEAKQTAEAPAAAAEVISEESFAFCSIHPYFTVTDWEKAKPIMEEFVTKTRLRPVACTTDGLRWTTSSSAVKPTQMET